MPRHHPGAMWELPRDVRARMADATLESPNQTHNMLRVFDFSWQIADAENNDDPRHAASVTQSEWEFWSPAFRLATLILTEPRLIDWVDGVGCGVVHRTDTNDPGTRTLYWPTGPSGERHGLRIPAIDFLRERLKNEVMFIFKNAPVLNANDPYLWSRTRSYGNIAVIELDREFLVFAQLALQEDRRIGIDEELIGRVQWTFAMILCREIINAIWEVRWRNDRPTSTELRHPYHWMDRDRSRRTAAPTLGDAWTDWMFGFNVFKYNMAGISTSASELFAPRLEATIRVSGTWANRAPRLAALIRQHNNNIRAAVRHRDRRR